MSRCRADAVRLADQLVAENRRKVQAGVLTDLDVAQSLSQLASSRASLLAAQQLVIQDENNLKALITDQYRELHDVQLVPAEKLLAVPEMFDLEGSWQTAMTKRPDLLQAKVAVERLDVNRRFQKNQLFPELDLTGSYGRTGLAGNLGGAYGQIPANTYPNYSYGADPDRSAGQPGRAQQLQSRQGFHGTGPGHLSIGRAEHPDSNPEHHREGQKRLRANQSHSRRPRLRRPGPSGRAEENCKSAPALPSSSSNCKST